MKKLLLKTVRIIFIVLLLQTTFSTIIVFWAEDKCNSCGTTPPQFQQYKNFVTDILNSIWTVWTEWEYTGKPVPPSWFQSRIFEIPEENQFTINKLIGWMKDRFKKTASTFGATTAILFSIWREIITKDGVGWFLILFKWRTFVEARRMLLDLDSLIHNKMFELWLGGWFFDKIAPINRENIQKTIQKYIKSTDSPNTLLEYVKLNEWVKYFHITEMLLRTNSAMKTFIWVNKISQFENKEFQKWRIKDKWKWLFEIKFNYKEIENMKENYQCARWIQWLINCDKTFKKFIANIKDITGDNIKWAKKATKTIFDASKKLAKTFSVTAKQALEIISDAKRTELNDKDQAFLDEEEKLLMQLYGLNTSKMIENGWLAKTNKFRSAITSKDLSIKDSLQQSEINQNIQNQKDEIIKEWNRIIQKTENLLSNNILENRNDTIRNCLDIYDKKERKEYLKLINIYFDKHESELENKLTSCSEVNKLVEFIDKNLYTKDNISFAPIKERDNILKNTKPKEEIIALYIESMDKTINRQQQQIKNATIADVSDLTLLFDEIFEQIHITKKIIWTKDEGIINNLWESCTLQCKNKEWTCYYNQE